MTPYDVLMIGIIVVGMVWGAMRGITWQLASLASLILGYAGSMTLSGQLAPHLPGQPIVARGLSMLVAYVLISAGIFGAAWLIRATLRKLRFEAYDRHLGMILGGLEGIFVGVVLSLFALSLAPSTRQPIMNSPSGRAVGHLLAAVEPVLPTEMRGELGPLWRGETRDPQAADEWSELKQPLVLSRRSSRSADSRTADTPSSTPKGDTRLSRGFDRMPSRSVPDPTPDGDDDPTLGRVVADTIDAGLGKIGSREGRAPDSRRRRIGRALGDILSKEIDRLGSRRDEARSR